MRSFVHRQLTHTSRTWSRVFASALAAAWLASCGGKAIVGEGRAGAGASDGSVEREAGAGGSPGSGGSSAGGSGGSSGSGDGSGQFVTPVFVNDPCNAAGFIDFLVSRIATDVVKTTAYVVAFDPPQILLAKDVTSGSSGDFFRVSVDHLDLPGAPDCVALRSDAVFLVETLSDGTLRGPGGLNLGSLLPYWCGSKIVSFDPRVEPTLVRKFGFHVGETHVDGPFPLSRGAPNSPSGYSLDGLDAGALSCSEPGYIDIVAAHAGELLVGLFVHTSEQPEDAGAP